MHLNGRTADNALDIVQFEKCGNVYQNLNLNNSPIPFVYGETIDNISFEMHEVEQYLNELCPHSSPGPGNIHPLLLKKSVDSINCWITKVLNLSIRSGIFPMPWKISFLPP